jgi:hypothetical protein
MIQVKVLRSIFKIAPLTFLPFISKINIMSDLWFEKAKVEWNKKKRLHRSNPNITQMITSFTDKQPLHGWVKADAIREFWQNFKNGLSNTFEGADIRFSVENDLVLARAGQHELGRVDLRDRDSIVFTQKFCLLEESHLQLASFKSKDSIGGHGEGFKVGINLLLRFNTTITYTMPFKTWKFSLKNVYGEHFCNMVADIENINIDSDDMVIKISGRNIKAAFEVPMDIDLMNNFKCICSTNTGAVYVCDNAYHGNAYCRKLFVTRDFGLQRLQLAINLNMQVSRDRHLLHTPAVPKLVLILKESLIKVAENVPKANKAFDHILRIMKS